MNEVTKLLYWADVSNSISNVSIAALCMGFVILFFSAGTFLFINEDFEQKLSFKLIIISVIWELFFIALITLAPSKTIFYAEASIKIEQELKANADNPLCRGCFGSTQRVCSGFWFKNKKVRKIAI